MGFDGCLGPESAIQALESTPGMKNTGADTLAQGLAMAFPSPANGGIDGKDHTR